MVIDEIVEKKSQRSMLQRLRVPIGFITAILFAWLARPTLPSLAIGLPVVILGNAFRGWASGHLRKNQQLAVSGPYAFTRNPLYFGSFLMALGFAIAGGDLLIGSWLVIFFLLIYWPVMKSEAEYMLSLFAEDYRKWATEVPLFIPGISPYKSAESRKFDITLYMKHREYRALLGSAIVTAVLLYKAIA